MARPLRDPRDIVLAAAEAFARFGLKRTQMADIAAAAGTALGTLYRYSKSKEALFGAVLRHAFHADDAEVLAALEDPSPSRAAIQTYVREFAAGTDFLPILGAACAQPCPADPAAEFRAVVAELFDVMNHHALAICIVDVTSREWPELSQAYDNGVRQRTRVALAHYLARRTDDGALVPTPDPVVAAHFLVELCGEFTRGRKHSSPNRHFATDELARETVLHIASRTFLPEP